MKCGSAKKFHLVYTKEAKEVNLITVCKYKENISDNRKLINLADSGHSEIQCLETE